jgi:hypothetical protein
VADECCDTSFDLVVASTDVPEVAPPTFLASANGPVHPVARSTPAPTVLALPPPSLERTTVLLI